MIEDVKPEPIVVTHEELFEEAALLEDARTITLDGMTAISGKHPVLGRVHMIAPAIGPALILFCWALLNLAHTAPLKFLKIPTDTHVTIC